MDEISHNKIKVCLLNFDIETTLSKIHRNDWCHASVWKWHFRIKNDTYLWFSIVKGDTHSIHFSFNRGSTFFLWVFAMIAFTLRSCNSMNLWLFNHYLLCPYSRLTFDHRLEFEDFLQFQRNVFFSEYHMSNYGEKNLDPEYLELWLFWISIFIYINTFIYNDLFFKLNFCSTYILFLH
jgi:hypothetical protein